MSYEGYDQVLCENGHYRVYDVFDPQNPCGAYPEYEAPISWRCTNCGTTLAWTNSVDQTNDNGDEYRAELELLEEAVYETCNLGHSHLIKEARYKIPELVGHCYENGEWKDG
jgi:hypothetical protein